MAAQQDQKMFGDDINSTPLTSLQPVMTSKADAGNVPLEPPVYNPNVPPAEEKRFAEDARRTVRFAEHTDTRQQRHHQPRQRYYPQQQQYIQQQPQQPQQPPPQKKKKLLELLGTYGQHMVVFALVFAVVWYYSTFAATSYFGNGTGYVSLMGGLFLASASSGVYGVSKHLLD
jgi:hypothetical protein